MRIGLTRYGQREIILSTILLGVAATGLAWLFPPAGLVPLAAWLWVLWFFRDPDRGLPTGEGLLVSPADGTVSDITPVGPDSELGCEGTRIGIFMSVLDVHVNRSPARATVGSVTYRPGRFLDARDPAAAERNESATIRMTCRSGARTCSLVVRQVAGLIARRIVTDVKIGQELHAGERIGMIKFGSRVELLAARDLVGQVMVQVGQRVKAGQSVLIACVQGGGNG